MRQPYRDSADAGADTGAGHRRAREAAVAAIPVDPASPERAQAISGLAQVLMVEETREIYSRIFDEQSVIRKLEGLSYGIAPMPLVEVFPGEFEGGRSKYCWTQSGRPSQRRVSWPAKIAWTTSGLGETRRDLRSSDSVPRRTSGFPQRPGADRRDRGVPGRAQRGSASVRLDGHGRRHRGQGDAWSSHS